MILSIIIPAYNEERFIGAILRRVIAVPTEECSFEKDVIVVDDGSRDRTFELAEEFARNHRGVRVLRQSANQGRGRALRRGIAEAVGSYIMIQDADLEYDPQDYLPMLRALGAGEDRAVFGSRTLRQLRERGWFRPFPGKHPAQAIGPWLAGIILSGWTAVLYGRLISDTLTALKVYPAGRLKSFPIRTCGFDTDFELTARLIRAGVAIREVEIGYQPRTVGEGKKTRARDGFAALWTLLKYRFLD